ncbi:MAG: hypothetical protein HMLKMBBP_03352 [Planctomycetes bacterium]|nr:hypothetical protein [Planctomycetota bacterium]
MKTKILLLGLAIAACGDGGRPAAPKVHALPPAAGPAAALPAGLVLAAAPEGAKPVADVKLSAKEGEDVVLRGRIGMGQNPFVSGAAVMTIVDPKLVPCSEMSMDDGCLTPWDYCCTAKEEQTACTATVQILGADGKPLAGTLQGPFQPLWTVVVKGKVAGRPSPAILVVNAEGIYVEKR